MYMGQKAVLSQNPFSWGICPSPSHLAEESDFGTVIAEAQTNEGKSFC